jgi:hypothetical protein
MSNHSDLNFGAESQSLDNWINQLIARFNEVVYEVLMQINQVFDEVF